MKLNFVIFLSVKICFGAEFGQNKDLSHNNWLERIHVVYNVGYSTFVQLVGLFQYTVNLKYNVIFISSQVMLHPLRLTSCS